MLHLTNPHNFYRLGCRKKISITTFFQIWICSVQIDFIAIFRFERFHTSYDENIPLLLANAAPFPSLFLDLPTMPRPISFLSFDPLERFHWCLHPIIILLA